LVTSTALVAQDAQPADFVTLKAIKDTCTALRNALYRQGCQRRIQTAVLPRRGPHSLHARTYFPCRSVTCSVFQKAEIYARQALPKHQPPMVMVIKAVTFHAKTGASVLGNMNKSAPGIRTSIG